MPKLLTDIKERIKRARGPMATPRQRAIAAFELYVLDHQGLRALWYNLHRVSPRLWRSGQPAPFQIARLAARGIKTIVNLRGARDDGGFLLEAEACRRHGVALVNFQTGSREPPTRDVVRAAKAMFETIEYPALLHCKSGADRAGMMSALYLILREGRPAEEALRQLALRYGHVKHAKTGVIDFFFESYRDHAARTGMEFMRWVEEVYDWQAMRRAFHDKRWASLIVDKVLRRE
jgi:protein tyrosine/serine phosphatase